MPIWETEMCVHVLVKLKVKIMHSICKSMKVDVWSFVVCMFAYMNYEMQKGTWIGS